jgi:hypothetical protein
MAAEPEKRIEESLHAYARKRREEAGAPLEMHPATRRMLQGEVAKLKAAQPPERRAWWQSFFLVWPRFAAAVGMFAVLAVGVWVFTQSEGHRSSEVGQVASSRASEGLAEVEDLARLKDRAEAPKEVDRIAPSASADEELGKKLAEKRAVRALDESKVQLRDAEKVPAAPAATPPAPVTLSDVAREKQVAVQYDTPAQQMKESKTVLSVAAGDKSGDLSSSLSKERAEGNRGYRVEDGRRFVQATDPAMKEGLGVSGAAPIAPAVTLAPANKPVDSYSFAFQTPPTGLVGALGDAQRLNLEVTNVFLGFDVATYVADELRSPASGPVTAAAEGAAARAELFRSRALQPATGAEATVGQKFERQGQAVGPALLQKFELQQHVNGRISIRDADGTVYEGEILAAKADSDTDVKAKVANELQETNRRLVRSDALAIAAPSSVWFRASGTNKSKELVVINGELLREEDQLGRSVVVTGKNAADAAGAVAAPTTAPTQSEPALRAQAQGGAAITRAPARFAEAVSGVNTSATVFVPTTIRGRVQIGKTNQLELRAIRSR